MYSEQGSALLQKGFDLAEITAVEVVLRIVVTLAVGVLYEIDAGGIRHFGVLLYQPRKGVSGVAAEVREGTEGLAYLAAIETAKETAQVAVTVDGVDVVGEVDMAVSAGGDVQLETLHQDVGVLVDDGYLQAVALPEQRILGTETSVLVALRVDQFFGTGDEEERVVNQVSTDDARLARLLYDRASHVREHDVFAEVPVGDNHYAVVSPLLLVRGVAELRCCLRVAVEEELLDVVDNGPDVCWCIHRCGTICGF